MEPPAPAPVSAEAANLLRRQQQLQAIEPPASTSASPPASASSLSVEQQQQAMEVYDFEGVDFVRLRLLSGRRAYLHAAEDGRSVRLDPLRESHNAVWAVTRRFDPDGNNFYGVLLRGAYGRYLGAPDATTHGSLCCPSSSRSRAAEQRDLDRPEGEVPAIMWQAAATSRQGAFLLRDATARYLRANSSCSGVHVSARAGLCTATQWVVERVPRAAGRPELPIPPDGNSHSHFARVCPPLSRLFVLERGIRWVCADDYGTFSEDNWSPSRFTGRHTSYLKRHLVSLMQYQDPGRHYRDCTVCVRAGRYGQLSPLVVDLPRSREPLDLVLFEHNTAADNQFRYPDVNAVAAAAAVEEPVV